ncbi:MAG: hypothetical protein KJ634_04260 [Gammaproteobacteria bacterium]|nr:hypothetical protein [Gammaproteobacteria bacterium]MBU1414819.1 hypothetical protein [Gammaproteobacteria bacterium]
MTVSMEVAVAASEGLPKVKAAQYHAPSREEHLPFTVSIASTQSQLQKAVALRHAAYARHVPEFAAKLTEPENADFDPGTIVLIAESKLDGSALGTMRIQTNQFAPLNLESSVTLPEWLEGFELAEATRLGIIEGPTGRLVKTVLFKAYFLYCQSAKIDWMVITARKPLDRQYDALLFQDVFATKCFIPMRHVGGMPHRVMAFNIPTAELRWKAAHHPLHGFMCLTAHPDINVHHDIFDQLSIRVAGSLESRTRINPRI